MTLLSFVKRLKCARCKTEYSLSQKLCMCPRNDDGRLDIEYDYQSIKERINKRTFLQRSPTVWKYFELLPVEKKRNIVTLEAGRHTANQIKESFKENRTEKSLHQERNREPNWFL